MSTGFSSEIFAQKLVKLNISQQSIETLSHWCVFHHRCCQQVVETWDRDFHSAPQERKISLLYLANDIMQNSKKDGMRYIHEFFKVIAAALDDLFTNGDDFGRNVVQRLYVIEGCLVLEFFLDLCSPWCHTPTPRGDLHRRKEATCIKGGSRTQQEDQLLQIHRSSSLQVVRIQDRFGVLRLVSS